MKDLLSYLDAELKTSGGDFLVANKLTGADIRAIVLSLRSLVSVRRSHDLPSRGIHRHARALPYAAGLYQEDEGAPKLYVLSLR
jgi:glutathione S-transferase